MERNKHILVIRLSAMGDVAMSVPVIRAFVAQNPNTKITILSRKFLKPLFENLPNVNFYAAEVEGKHKGFLGLYRLSKELKALNIDAIADLHNVLRSKILRLFFLFTKLDIAVIDKGRAEKRALTRSRHKIFKPLISTHERYAKVFKKLGFFVDLNKPQFPEKENISHNILKIIGNSNTVLIGIAPFAQYKSKMYPLDLLGVVIEKLSRNKTYKILLFGGGKKEEIILKKIASKYKNTFSLAGKVSFKEELNLMTHLHCMVSMDSGNAHLAAMQGVKTITLWGVTHPYTGFAPYNQPIENAITADLNRYPNIPCSIYGNKECDGYKDVMRSIPPSKIINSIQNLLKS